MNIQEITESFKSRVKGLLSQDEVYTLFLVLLVGAAAFGLGRASVDVPVGMVTAVVLETSAAIEDASEVKVQEPVKSTISEELPDSGVLPGKYVASKTGTKYHLPTCGGAKQIKEENKVWFTTKEEAEGAGYTPAANCKF